MRKPPVASVLVLSLPILIGCSESPMSPNGTNVNLSFAA